MRQLLIAGATLGVLLSGPVAARAQWSIAGSVGIPDADIDVAVYDPPRTTADDSSPVGWKSSAGCAFGESLGLELGYAHFGSEYQLFNQLGYGEVVTFEPSAAFVTLVGRVTVRDHVHVFARLGAAYWTVRMDYVEGSFRSSGRDGDLDPVIGFGFDFDLTDRLGLRFEWERFQNVGDDVSVARPAGAGSTIELGGHDVSMVGIGLTWRL